MMTPQLTNTFLTSSETSFDQTNPKNSILSPQKKDHHLSIGSLFSRNGLDAVKSFAHTILLIGRPSTGSASE